MNSDGMGDEEEDGEEDGQDGNHYGNEMEDEEDLQIYGGGGGVPQHVDISQAND